MKVEQCFGIKGKTRMEKLEQMAWYNNQKKKLYILRKVAISASRNATQKEAEKKLMCKKLCIEIERKWNMKRMVICVQECHAKWSRKEINI